MKKIHFINRKRKAILSALALMFLSNTIANAQSSWAAKVSSASTAGATAISGVMDAVTSLLMAIAAVAFLIGIVNAGFKYKAGDQHAFKNLQGVLMGSLIVLIGVGLAKILFF
ncbi:DUF4134 family protein [Arcicella sp. LKC2W]|uniref:DUF4134 family protein n=1 Tax=Arcicella sp. LKC2W TaxID=2984198 RepID=UPI002B21B0C9|nr:DUF4134 family protein [Arcicella sp. LKC2W]MEA5458731.1 DUF4134 family protein [Arcicella sp. LKC2W]